MIPNTDINCSKCATPMYSDCVMWSGGDLSCLVLTKDCCDTSITDVINKLGAYICNFSNVTDYMFPFCFESYSISDFHGMQQAMLTEICVLQSEIDTLEAKVGPLDFNWGCYSSGVTSSVTLAIQRLIDETCIKTALNLNWKCIPSGTTNSINDSLQAIINAESAQQISYNSSQFTVTGETGLCNKGLSFKTPSWVPHTFISADPTNIVRGGAPDPDYQGYLVDSLGNVRIGSALFTVNSTLAAEAATAITIGATGYYLPICELPPALYPVGNMAGALKGLRTKFFVDCYIGYLPNETFGGTGSIIVVDTKTSVSASTGYLKQTKRIIPASILQSKLTGNSKWYIVVDKAYFPGGVAGDTSFLKQDSTVRVYIDGTHYNINN